MRAPLFETQRSTASTRERALNMQRAIEYFQQCVEPISTDEISALLGFSPSGSRKYLQDLFNWSVIKVATVGNAGIAGSRTQYVIADDKEHIRAFVDRLREYQMTIPVAASTTDIVDLAAEERIETNRKKRQQQLFGDRQIHIAGDDVHYSVRLQKNEGEGKRDPLVSALFGPAKIVLPKL